MSSPVQYLQKMLEKAGIHQKKEKFSDRLLKHSAFGVQTNNKPAVSSQQQLGSMEAPENKPLTSAPITQNKPITQPLTQKPVQITGANQTHKAYSNPIRSSSPPKPPSPATTTKIPRPFSKIAYKRNTGLADSDGLPYTNTDDVILLNKLGYTIDENSYMFLPRGEEREGLYTYIEKNAGIPKSVTQCIDEGTAFSSEYLKDMDYEIPKGYEIKGDLCCPVEKTASTLVVSGIHGDEPAGDVAAEKLKGTTDVISNINPTDKRKFMGKDINRHFDKPVEGSIQQKLLDIIDSKRPSKVVALHEDDEVDKPYAYSSPSLAHEVKEALKDKDTATSAHNDKTDDGVISEGKNPPKGSLEKALDNRGIAHATIETPSKSQNMGERTKTHLDVIKSLLGKKAAVAAWQRSEGKNPEGGLNAKGRASYKKETGGTLKAPVTESNPKGERAKRQNSFCSRMCGMKRKNTGSEGQSNPDSRINKSLRKWNCKCGEAHESLFEKVACMLKESEGRCWEGYEPVPGKEAYSEDSCRPKGKKKESELEKEAADAYELRKLIIDASRGCRDSKQALSIMGSKGKGGKLKSLLAPAIKATGEAVQGAFPFDGSHQMEIVKKTIDPSYIVDRSKYLGR